MKSRIIGALLVAMGMGMGMASAQTPVTPEAVLLTVNGEPVQAYEVRLVMNNLAAQLQASGQQYDQERLFQASAQQVVDTKLLAQEAQHRELAAEPQMVDNIMTQVESEAGGTEALGVFLDEMGITKAQLRDSITESITAQRLIDETIRPAVQVTDRDVEAFYKENPEMFQRPEEVHARHILFKVDEGASEEDKVAARIRADDARARALEGADFAALAKELSEGPSAPNGGDLGFFSADRMVKPFADAAFALEPGSISDVVETQFGYHIINVEERRPPTTQSLDEVRESLKNGLIERKVGESIQATLEGLRDKADIVPTAAPPGSAEAGS
jgi:peptidyl-prolyl cis-trans isomerase C